MQSSIFQVFESEQIKVWKRQFQCTLHISSEESFRLIDEPSSGSAAPFAPRLFFLPVLILNSTRPRFQSLDCHVDFTANLISLWLKAASRKASNFRGHADGLRASFSKTQPRRTCLKLNGPIPRVFLLNYSRRDVWVFLIIFLVVGELIFDLLTRSRKKRRRKRGIVPVHFLPYFAPQKARTQFSWLKKMSICCWTLKIGTFIAQKIRKELRPRKRRWFLISSFLLRILSSLPSFRAWRTKRRYNFRSWVFHVPANFSCHL